MATGDPIGTVNFTFEYRLAGDPESMLTSLAADVTVDFDDDDAKACIATWLANMDVFAADSFSLGPGWCDILLEDAPSRRVAGELIVIGTSGGVPLPQNTAYLIRKLPASGGGRRLTGRMYIPGVPTNFVTDGGFVLPSVQADLQAALGAIFTDWAGRNVVGGALIHNPTPEFIPGPRIPNPAFPTDRLITGVAGLQVQPQVATQRRRMRP